MSLQHQCMLIGLHDVRFEVAGLGASGKILHSLDGKERDIKHEMNAKLMSRMVFLIIEKQMMHVKYIKFTNIYLNPSIIEFTSLLNG